MSPRWIRGKWVIAGASLVIDQEEVIPRSEDIIEPKVETPKVVRAVVLDGGARQPLVVQVKVDASVDYMIREATFVLGFIHTHGSGKSSLIDLVPDLRRELVREPEAWAKAKIVQSSASPIPHMVGVIDDSTGDPFRRVGSVSKSTPPPTVAPRGNLHHPLSQRKWFFQALKMGVGDIPEIASILKEHLESAMIPPSH